MEYSFVENILLIKIATILKPAMHLSQETKRSQQKLL